ncbi:MAG: EAL domain-containing protein [Betaproteobacteria bacterium]|nr:EAL domain-containing protein [Betaproteobacteria bacterium]
MANEPEQDDIAGNLIAALKGGQFILYFQAIKPIVSPGGQSSYREIFVRFLEEEQKLLPPGGFFPILEQQNLMATMDKWVISNVIRWHAAKRKLAQKNWNNTHCTINLSSDSIVGPGFANFVARQLAKSQVPPRHLLFEISEEDVDKYALSLDQFILPLKPLGCGFVVTDYSGELVSTEMLQALGINLVKIDGRIVRRIHEDEKSFADAGAIHEACREIGIRTIAELVERRETLAKLKKIGIDYAQGYGIAKPAPLE